MSILSNKVLTGRKVIYTSILPEHMQSSMYYGDTLDEKTLPAELQRAINIHKQNSIEIKYLIDYYKGEQDILERYKDDADKKVNNKTVINYAQASTRDIVGYTFGKPIQYVQRKQDYMADVKLLNDFMNAENKSTMDKQMADDQSICGTAFRAVFPDIIMPDEAPFELLYLNPLTTFVVYSTYNTNRPVYACSYFDITKDNIKETIYQVYTSNMNYVYKVSGSDIIDSKYLVGTPKPHILKSVPIIEYPNNQWRLGDWECAITLMNSINNMASDSLNDVEQTVLSYLALFGVELEDGDITRLKKDRVMTFKGVPGINQDAKFITAQIDGSSAQLLREYLEEALRVVIGIPDRKTRGGGGGDTGDAVKLRDGWADIEIVARNKELFTAMGEKALLRIVLNILKPKHINSKITIADIDIKFSRNKTDNLQSKVQSGSTMYNMGMDKSDIAETMDITTDIGGLVERWKKSEAEKLKIEVEKAIERTDKTKVEVKPNDEPKE